jgi:hypothetical protein
MPAELITWEVMLWADKGIHQQKISTIKTNLKKLVLQEYGSIFEDIPPKKQQKMF